MFNRLMLWFLERAYRFHRNRELYYGNKAYEAHVDGLGNWDTRYDTRCDYHRHRGTQISKLIYKMRDS